MYTESINEFMRGDMPPESFAREISAEVEAYEASLARSGSSVPVFVDGDRSSIHVDAAGLRRLCDAFLSGFLSSGAVRYVCDALDLVAPSYSSDWLRQLIEQLADPQPPGHDLTEDEVRGVRDAAH